MRLAAFALLLLATASARAEEPSLLKDVPQEEPKLRPLAITLFGASAVAAGFAGYFAVQSDNARSQLSGLSSSGTNTSLSQAQAFSAFRSATSNGQAAVSLLAGAALIGGMGAFVWWYGSTSIAVQVTPGGASISGAFW